MTQVHTLPSASAAAREDFLLLDNTPWVYFDSASTALKPKHVLDAIISYHRDYASNVGRANHLLAEQATLAFESVRAKVADLLQCYCDELVFTFNCTDSINLAAQALGLVPGVHVIVSELEHHSNLLPWLARAQVSVVRTDAQGLIDVDHLHSLLRNKPAKLVAATYVSNITGNVQPVAQICRLAREHQALTLIDAAQAVGHIPIDVNALDCDFLAFSGHKMLGPSGVGVLFMRRSLQPTLCCGRRGGGMVNKIDGSQIDYHTGPARFEAGTPNIEGVLGLGAALDYLNRAGVDNIERNDRALEAYFWERAQRCEQLVFPFPRAPQHLPIFTFRPRGNVDINYISRILSDRYQIATSAGYQCNQPMYRNRGLNGGIRASLHLYNETAEIDRLFDALDDLSLLLS